MPAANIHTLTNSGTIDVVSGTVLNITASGTDTNSGTINVGDSSGAGTLKISGSAITLSGTRKGAARYLISPFGHRVSFLKQRNLTLILTRAAPRPSGCADHR